MPKLAIVTGGSKGIGFEIIERLSKEMEVLCISRSGFDTDKNPTANTVHNIDGGVDLSHPDIALDQLSDWLSKHPDYHVTYLIHNAAVLELGRTLDLELENYNRALNINVLSPFGITKLIYGRNRFSAQMEEGAHSSVIYVTSSAARDDKVFESMGLYSATKAMLNKMASIQRKELDGTNIHVHRVYPGIVDTDMQTTLRTDSRLTPSFKDSIGAVPDLKHDDWKAPEDAAAAPRRISPGLSARFVLWAANRSLSGANIADKDMDFYAEEGFHVERLAEQSDNNGENNSAEDAVGTATLG